MISKNNQKGSILIGIIVAMVLFAALGTAILSLTSTATMNQVMANSAARAYYLAESGFRYAYYHQENGNNLESTLEMLHDETLTLNNNDGSSHLNVYPYYLKVNGDHPQGAATLNAKFPGGLSDDFTSDDETNKIKIGPAVYGYGNIEHSSGSVDVSFTNFTGSLPHILDGTDVLFMAMANASQTVTAGGSLDLKAMTGLQFPQRNGIVEIDGHICSYRKYNHDNNSLTGIKIYDDDPQDFTVTAEQEIILQKFAKVESIGTFGTGDHQSVRKIVYYVPFPIKDRGERVEFPEKFDDDLSQLPWTSVLGSHEVYDHALKVTGTGDVGSSDSGSLIIFEWETETEAEPIMNLGSFHKYAGNYLSYDAQVKIGFDSESVPGTYMAGISFRILEGYNFSYGISFGKSSKDIIIPDDEIPNSLVPGIIKGNPSHSIVLWQNTEGEGGGRKWLAYKSLSTDINFNINNATILVRIIEAASIKFTSGLVPVKTGDIVIGQISGATGKVVGSPILKSGIWANGNAEGIILLNNVRGTFTAGETIKVGSTIIATVDSGPEPYSEKDNYIRAYYGIVDSIPLGTIEWPPDSTNLTLVKWDDYNSSVSSVELLGIGKENDAIIQTGSLLTTDDPFPSTKPEIGLHTFGINSTSIYFDDFAMQAVIKADSIILPVVQE
ncbi:MAG: hypothetical protein J7L71_09265 [Spirochaetaceae bacterium]|nr:hypothetical protein [Spirochaetaceae bacterium]